MTSRIDTLFTTLKAANKTALIPFITAGYPNKESTVKLLHTLVENGADMIEIGVPFSDPVADGPIIQQSSFTAIKNKVTVNTVFDFVREFRNDNQHTPLVLMGYANPIEAFGWEEYAKTSKEVGVDGILTVDLLPETNDSWGKICQQQALNRIVLLAPTTSDERQKHLIPQASGFIYYVALKGVTGSDTLEPQQEQVAKAINKVKSHTATPVVVGFGIKDVESAKQLSQCADGIVIGSQIISILSKHQEDIDEGIKKVGQFTAQLKQGIQ